LFANSVKYQHIGIEFSATVLYHKECKFKMFEQNFTVC